MKKYIYLLFYCFVCSLPLFAQENGTPRKQAISQKDTFGISLPSMEAEPAMKNMNEPQLGL